MRRIAGLVLVLAGLCGSAFAGGVDSCGANGTTLAAGATTAECLATLPTRTDMALACMTIAKANVVAGSQATKVKLVVGVSNPEAGANPMAPYTGFAHVGSILPETTVAAGDKASLTDMRIDVIADTSYWGGTSVPGEPPFVLGLGANGTTVPQISEQISNVGSAALSSWSMYEGHICVPIGCYQAGKCNFGLE